MANPLLTPPGGRCYDEMGDSFNLAVVAQATSIVANASGGAAGTFTSSPQLVTTSGSIPAGVRSWSFAAVSGTVTLNGAAVANGTSISGGGYPGLTLGTPIPYTVSGSALVTTDT